MIIHIVTSNEGKFREMSRMVAPLGHEVVKENIPYPEIQADTLREVVEYGMEWILANDRREWMEKSEHGFIIDDSGLFIEALKGFPGVYSKFVFLTIGNPGILRLLEGGNNRRAEFRTALMFHYRGENHYFEGISKGKISLEARGTGGFGYDPIFIPDGAEKTFGEMNTDEKNSFSHRGEAMERFVSFLGEALK